LYEFILDNEFYMTCFTEARGGLLPTEAARLDINTLKRHTRPPSDVLEAMLFYTETALFETY
jgi:hypothetical protein